MTSGTARNPRALLAEGRAALGFAEDPLREAKMLLAASLSVPFHHVALLAAEDVSDGSVLHYRSLVARRRAREPMSHILGYRDFYKHRFRVTADVLDPRPETEALVEEALREPFESLLDLGTGSGAIAVSLLAERREARGLATDVSGVACRVARDNAAALGVGDRLEVREADWFNGVDGAFDLIVSNPPYIAASEMDGLAPEVRLWEPRLALTDERDGLAAYRAIAAGAPKHLTPRGRLVVEIGSGQSAAVVEIFRAVGLEDVAVKADLDSRPRLVTARPRAKTTALAP